MSRFCAALFLEIPREQFEMDGEKKHISLKGSILLGLIACGPLEEMPGQAGDPGEISGAKGTSDVTVSGARTLPRSLPLLHAREKRRPMRGVWVRNKVELIYSPSKRTPMEVKSSEKLRTHRVL